MRHPATRIAATILAAAALGLLAACSVTRNLPEGEVLYDGQKKTEVLNRCDTPEGENALEDVEAALYKAPNNTVLGIHVPIPFGLWVYNSFVKYEKGFGRWIFNRFAAQPVLLSGVNPGIRCQAAENILKEYGFFNGKVDYDILPNAKDSLKAKVRYRVDMANPYYIDTVCYQGFSPRTQAVMELSRRRSLIRPGEHFNVADLDGERTRLSNLLRNIGYYYFRPDSMIFTTENQLKDLGDKLPADKKAPIEAALQKLKDAHKTQDLAAIDSAMAELNTAFQAASAEMYAQSNAQNGAQAGPDMNANQANGGQNSKQGENVQDADFEEVK